MSQRIAIGVGGRFHSDHMVWALSSMNHHVELFTTLPKFRFPAVPSGIFHSFVLPEMLYRAGKSVGLEEMADSCKMRMFGKSWARALKKSPPFQSLIGWSSFSLEAFQTSQATRFLMRDSCHIETQFEILREEYQRIGVDLPDRKICIQRELEEYQLADQIFVLSEAAKRSFLAKGFPGEKLHKIRLGVDTGVFRPAPSLSKEGRPLRIVYFGSLLIRKGIPYLLEATKAFSKKEIELTLVGAVAPEMKKTLSQFTHFKYRPAMPHPVLAEFLRTQDVFVLPSVEDGFGMVVPQAMASGIVPVVTESCGSADLLQAGIDGYILPSRDSQAIRETIQHLLSDEARLMRMKKAAVENVKKFSWDQCYWESLKAVLPPSEELRVAVAS